MFATIRTRTVPIISRARRHPYSTTSTVTQTTQTTSTTASTGTKSPSSDSPLTLLSEETYTKQQDDSVGSEPQTLHSGRKTYVVSEPAPAGTRYDVPGGAYASTSPYTPQTPASAPSSHKKNISSTSASPAHPTLTSSTHTAQNPSGVDSSSAVRYRSAPGEMKKGGDGGLNLMDSGTTKNSEQAGLASRNPQPLGEEEGKKGIHEAWKHRK